MPKKPKRGAKRSKSLTVTSSVRGESSPSSMKKWRGHVEESITALGQATDALVTRVVGAAREGSRDPAEHVLDLSKAYFREEGGEGQHSVRCDRCGLKSPGASSARRASMIAESHGWFVSDEKDHCPACKDGAKLLTGGSAALVKPPKISGSDAILVTRLHWLAAHQLVGTSPAALLQNSQTSGHRRMLSALAEDQGYGVEKLRVHALALAEKHVDVPGAFRGADEGWAWLKELFQLLHEEDHPVVSP